jgi:integrase
MPKQLESYHAARKRTAKNVEIFQVLWELKKLGRADVTINNIRKCLYVLDEHADLNNPNEVKAFIANYDRKGGYKRNLVAAYGHYVKQFGLTWTKPIYHQSVKMPRIPQESQIENIMASASQKTATAIAMSKDTGLRPVELMRLKLKDIDFTKGAVYPETAKGGSPRALKLTTKTLNMLNKYLAKRNIQLNEKIFRFWTSDTYGKWFRYYRNKTAEKLQDPSIKTIRLYDLRHFFATMLYHKTKDILFVKQQMGHRKIETTLIYTQLLQFERDENYTCKVAKNLNEATQLIENGFEYITEMDEHKLFRKRK